MISFISSIFILAILDIGVAADVGVDLLGLNELDCAAEDKIEFRGFALKLKISSFSSTVLWRFCGMVGV